MQERRNKYLFISLLVLIALTVSAWWFVNNENTLDVDKNVFRVEELEAVDKVILKSGEETVALAFNGTRWRVNDRYDADRKMVTVLMATLKEAEPRRPVTGAMKDSLSQSLEKNGIQVSLFKGQSMLRTFYAGGSTGKNQSYFKDPETGNIYLMTIPGYRVYVSGILELDENGWRDKYVFGFNGRNFQGLQAEFPSKSSENFKVSRMQDQFGVEGVPKTDTARLYTYLDEVLTLTATEYVDPSPLTDSLLTVKPQMVITVSDIANRNYVLRLYLPVGGRVPAIFNDNQGIMFDPSRIRSLIRPKSFFVSK